MQFAKLLQLEQLVGVSIKDELIGNYNAIQVLYTSTAYNKI